MDQFDQLDDFDPFFTPVPVPTPGPIPVPTPIALTLLPLATYPSKEALFEAIQNWAKLWGYAFTISRSTRTKNGHQRVTYVCDRCWSLPRREPQIKYIRDTQSRGLECPFSITAAEIPGLGWEVRYYSEARFNIHNHPPSQSPAVYPSYRKLPVIAQNTARNLFLAG